MGIGICIEERKRHCLNDYDLFGKKNMMSHHINDKQIDFSKFKDCYNRNNSIKIKKKIKKLKKRLDRLENKLLEDT